MDLCLQELMLSIIQLEEKESGGADETNRNSPEPRGPLKDALMFEPYLKDKPRDCWSSELSVSWAHADTFLLLPVPASGAAPLLCSPPAASRAYAEASAG